MLLLHSKRSCKIKAILTIPMEIVRIEMILGILMEIVSITMILGFTMVIVRITTILGFFSLFWYNLMLIDNGWYLILENITCGYGNHAWYIEFNISLVITITTRDIFQYQIPAIIYLPNVKKNVLKK